MTARRKKYPGGFGDFEGNPDLEFVKYPHYISGKPENGRCGARLYKIEIQDYLYCRSWAIKPGGRCGRHGGLSTGARSEEGIRRQRQGYQRWLVKQREAKDAE